MDIFATYVASKPWILRPNMVLVEGTTDQGLFDLADRLAKQDGHKLLGGEIAFVASGRSDEGGTFGVAREFTTLRSLARIPLDASGRPVYKVLGLVDNDHAGRLAIKDMLRNYRGVQEFVDVLAIRPTMPRFSRPDALGRKRECESANSPFLSLDWEIEDVLSTRLLLLFERTHRAEILGRRTMDGRTHFDLTGNGKKELHRLVHREATLNDLIGVVEIVRTVRSMLNLADVVI